MALKILLITDDGSFTDHLCRALAAAGHAPILLAEGKDPQRAIRQERPDVVLVAVKADKVPLAAAECRVFTPEGPRNVPVIVITGSPKLEAELLDVFDLIPLPLDLNRLLEDLAVIGDRPAAEATPLTLDHEVYEEFCGHLRSRTGLHFEQRNRSALWRGIKKRMTALHLDSCGGYLDYLKRHGESRQELQKLLMFLTVGETFFFRYPAHFDALKELLVSAKPDQPLRIWSAGCSTGEEPYSIAMTIMETVPNWRDRDIKVIATDINHQSLARAREGIYGAWSLRTTTQRDKERFFNRSGESFAICEDVKRLVKFHQMNLSVPCSGDFCSELIDLDAIFCRNVLIYFCPETAPRVLGNFARHLKPGGQLFLGHAESLLPRDPELEIRRREDSFYYVKKEQGTVSPPPPAQPQLPAALPLSPTAHTETNSSTRLESARELFESDQLEEAFDQLQELLKHSPALPAALVLKGFILTAKGRLEEALESCCQALRINDLLPEAYFLRGMVLDAWGMLSEAAEEYRKALLLDQNFAMPHYHMGQLHLRQGRVPEAAREIRNTIRILTGYRDEETVPYSGGLSRKNCLEQLHHALAQVA